MTKRFFTCAFGGFVAMAYASTASAAPGFCTAYMHNNVIYVTDVFDLPPTDSGASIHNRFSRFVDSTLGQEPYNANCNAFGDQSEAAQTLSIMVQNSSAQGKTVKSIDGFLQWLNPGPRPRAVAKAAPKKAEPKPVVAKAEPAQTPTETAIGRHSVVAERNRLAQERYEAELAAQKAKVAEYERAKDDVARRKAEQAAAAQQVLAEHQRQMQAYDEQVLAEQQQQMQAQDKQTRLRQRELASRDAKNNGKGGRFQATGGVLPTRDAALASLMKLPLPAPLTDIQCDTVKMFTPPKWTCWGFYTYTRKAEGASAQ